MMYPKLDKSGALVSSSFDGFSDDALIEWLRTLFEGRLPFGTLPRAERAEDLIESIYPHLSMDRRDVLARAILNLVENIRNAPASWTDDAAFRVMRFVRPALTDSVQREAAITSIVQISLWHSHRFSTGNLVGGQHDPHWTLERCRLWLLNCAIALAELEYTETFDFWTRLHKLAGPELTVPVFQGIVQKWPSDAFAWLGTVEWSRESERAIRSSLGFVVDRYGADRVSTWLDDLFHKHPAARTDLRILTQTYSLHVEVAPFNWMEVIRQFALDGGLPPGAARSGRLAKRLRSLADGRPNPERQLEHLDRILDGYFGGLLDREPVRDSPWLRVLATEIPTSGGAEWLCSIVSRTIETGSPEDEIKRTVELLYAVLQLAPPEINKTIHVAVKFWSETVSEGILPVLEQASKSNRLHANDLRVSIKERAAAELPQFVENLIRNLKDPQP